MLASEPRVAVRPASRMLSWLKDKYCFSGVLLGKAFMSVTPAQAATLQNDHDTSLTTLGVSKSGASNLKQLADYAVLIGAALIGFKVGEQIAKKNGWKVDNWLDEITARPVSQIGLYVGLVITVAATMPESILATWAMICIGVGVEILSGMGYGASRND